MLLVFKPLKPRKKPLDWAKVISPGLCRFALALTLESSSGIYTEQSQSRPPDNQESAPHRSLSGESQ